MQLLRAADLLPLSLEPNWVDLDPDQRHSLTIDADDGGSLGEDDLLRVARWLRQQPVPVIGLSEVGDGLLADAVDLLVHTEDELAQLLQRVDRNPNASAVLVQVLRAVGALNITQGLMLESLGYATLQAGAEFARWLSGYQAEHPQPTGKTEPESPVLLKRREGTLEIVLNSPANRNALSTYMRDALTEAFKLVAMDPDIARVAVRGHGPCFSAGGDLSEFGSAKDFAESHRTRMLRMPAQYLAPHAERYTFHVHRACIGAGIEMPAFAGRITARPDTVFQLPEVAMGLIPGAGGCVSIPRRIGRQRAAQMAIMGDPIGAEVALAWGLIDAIED